MPKKRIVKKIDDGVDRTKVLCTTYQMRNPFLQFADGFANELDAMCYSIHMQAAVKAPTGSNVLDLCCGRGLLIPFLRYHAREVKGYVGIDIEPKNATFVQGHDPRRRAGELKTDWGFPVHFIESNVDSFADEVRRRDLGPFDFVVYTSSIEHMQPQSQRASLREAARVSRLGTVLYLTCPVTEPGHSGWAARYAAHVYEPNQDEILEWLDDAGWELQSHIGLVTSAREFRSRLHGTQLETAERLYRSMIRPFALVAIAALFPQSATERAYISTRRFS